MVYMAGHGGGCCGILHIAGWSQHHREEYRDERGFRKTRETPLTAEAVKDLIKISTSQGDSQGMLVEAVLTNAQLKNRVISSALLGAGFELVSRFKNPNSGNICNVFHYNEHPRSTTSRLPFKPIEKPIVTVKEIQ